MSVAFLYFISFNVICNVIRNTKKWKDKIYYKSCLSILSVYIPIVQIFSTFLICAVSLAESFCPK